MPKYNLKIGDSLFLLDRFRKYEGEWKEVTIVGETPRSWVIGCFNHAKINKITLQRNIPNYSPEQFYTRKGMEDKLKREGTLQAIKSYFSTGNPDISTDKLEKILEILKK